MLSPTCYWCKQFYVWHIANKDYNMTELNASLDNIQTYNTFHELYRSSSAFLCVLFFICTGRLYPYPSGPWRIWVNVSHDSEGKYEDFGARSRHMGPGKVIYTSHSILWGVITYPGPRYLHLVPKSTYPDSKVYGANMGPIWALSARDGPHVGPMNLTIRV